jgi:type IV secretory pathway VirB10-like protein
MAASWHYLRQLNHALLACVVAYPVAQQLDKQMHKMMHEKHRRQEQIRADQAAMDRIDETIKTNIQPCLVSRQEA